MTTLWSRRAFLHASGAALAAGTLFTAARPAAAADADEFDRLRGVWRDIVLGRGIDPAVEPFRTRLTALANTAAGHRDTMARAAGSLWPDLPLLTDSAAITGSYQRLNALAQAYHQPGTGLTGHASVPPLVATGLAHIRETVYNPSTTRFGNSWDWDIGTPLALTDVLALMYEHLPAEEIAASCASLDHWHPTLDGWTGGNLTDGARTMAVRGVVGKDPSWIARARDGLSQGFPYVSSGDGLYADGSFVQHLWVAYTGSYGAVMLDGYGKLFTLLAGSSWEVTDPQRRHVFDAVDNAFAPWLYNGLVMDAVCGRSISRGLQQTATVAQDDHSRGQGFLGGIALLAESAPADERERWRGMVKGWLERETVRPVLTDPQANLQTIARLSALVRDPAVRARPEPVEHRLFPAMDRAVHRRAGWAAALSMYSSRIQPYECLNREHLHGWHSGSGMLQWYGADFGNDQYSDAFWPTVDPYRLPGTTVTAKPLADGAGGGWGNGRSDRSWVGGTTDGEYAAVGQDLKGVGSTLTARKSWFFLDDAIVCLGAGITAADGYAAETVVDNRNLGASSTAALTVDGRTLPSDRGRQDRFPGAGWAHLAGHAGYVFPQGADLCTLRDERTGSWADINAMSAPAPLLTRGYATLWHDHGLDPVDASYAHILMPGADARATARRAADRGWLRTLANTADQQGVRVARLGVTAVNFWRPGTVGALTADTPASVLVRLNRDGTATLCVSDPTHLAEELTVVWHHRVGAVVSRTDRVAEVTTGAEMRLKLTGLKGTMGATHRVTVSLG
ncbi:polysaccharide lyase 8 family protein [Streptomyces sp. DT224]|uniref:polysaccharide lyase 8 family protein n=1 Tax=Streptomyces sp. DT224 TaxID=3393426 RepID=UPI003CFA8FA0